MADDTLPVVVGVGGVVGLAAVLWHSSKWSAERDVRCRRQREQLARRLTDALASVPTAVSTVPPQEPTAPARPAPTVTISTPNAALPTAPISSPTPTAPAPSSATAATVPRAESVAAAPAVIAPPPVITPPAAPPVTPAPPAIVTAPASTSAVLTAPPPMPGRWVWPVETYQGRRSIITNPWSKKQGRTHRGVDILFRRTEDDLEGGRALRYAPNVERWRELVQQLAPELAQDYLLSWIQVESGGNPCALGIPETEAGLFQSHHPADDRHGATFAELRAACTPDKQTATRALSEPERVRQVRSGVALVRACVEHASGALDAVGARWPIVDVYCLGKLVHALQLYVAPFLRALRERRGHPPRGWSEFRIWVRSLSDAEIIAIDPAVKPWASLTQRDRLFGIAERVGTAVVKIGGPYIVPPGVRALAAGDGIVWSAGPTARGFAVVIDHKPLGYATYYAHLSELFVRPTERSRSGERVYAGQPIGVVGADPLDWQHLPHLHFELWAPGPSNSVDPWPLMRTWDHVTVPSGGWLGSLPQQSMSDVITVRTPWGTSVVDAAAVQPPQAPSWNEPSVPPMPSPSATPFGDWLASLSQQAMSGQVTTPPVQHPPAPPSNEPIQASASASVSPSSGGWLGSLPQQPMSDSVTVRTPWGTTVVDAAAVQAPQAPPSKESTPSGGWLGSLPQQPMSDSVTVRTPWGTAIVDAAAVHAPQAPSKESTHVPAHVATAPRTSPDAAAVESSTPPPTATSLDHVLALLQPAIGAVQPPPEPSHRNAALTFRSVGRRGEPYPDWVRRLDGASGVYVIREIATDGSAEIVYVGESHTDRLYDTLTRHFQQWRRTKNFWRGQFAEGHDPGLTYDRNKVEVAIQLTPRNEAIEHEARLIQQLRPRDNVIGQPAIDEVPF